MQHALLTKTSCTSQTRGKSDAACDLATPQYMRSLEVDHATADCEAPARYLSLQFLDPALGLGKAVFACNVKHNDSCSCTPASHTAYCQNISILMHAKVVILQMHDGQRSSCNVGALNRDVNGRCQDHSVEQTVVQNTKKCCSGLSAICHANHCHASNGQYTHILHG